MSNIQLNLMHCFKKWKILLYHPNSDVGRHFEEYDKTTILSVIFLPNNEYNTGCFMYYITPKLQLKICIEEYKLHDYLPQSVDTSTFQIASQSMEHYYFFLIFMCSQTSMLLFKIRRDVIICELPLYLSKI